MYSYDRTAAILPLLVDKARVTRWINHLRRGQRQTVKSLVIFPGRTDRHIGASVIFNDGSNERFEIELKLDWKGDALEINPRIRGISTP